MDKETLEYIAFYFYHLGFKDKEYKSTDDISKHLEKIIKNGNKTSNTSKNI